MFEFPAFEKGTKAVMDAVVAATSKGAITIIGRVDRAYIHSIYEILQQVVVTLQLQQLNMMRKRKSVIAVLEEVLR